MKTTQQTTDDGYQGRDAYGPSTLTDAQREVVDLAFQIAALYDQVIDANDREQYGRAGAIRRQIAPLSARLDALKLEELGHLGDAYAACEVQS